jgi:Zn-dependent protease with chaperone function
MGFYRTFLAYRRLTVMLISLIAGHLLLIALAFFALIRYGQLWLIPVILFLPLLILGLRYTTGLLNLVFSARDDDLLAANGLTAFQPERGDRMGEVLDNVAEEIAVASGSSQPDAKVCESLGLNAFLSPAAIAAGQVGQPGMLVVFTTAMAAGLTRQELQAVAAHLYAHKKKFERMFISMASAMFASLFAAADVFLLLNVLNWYFGGTSGFSTGPLVVVLTLGMIVAPVLAISLAQVTVIRRTRFLDDLGAVEITKDPDSLISALEKLAAGGKRLQAPYTMANVHFYFDAVEDKNRRFPWQRLATHPPAKARIAALKAATER